MTKKLYLQKRLQIISLIIIVFSSISITLAQEPQADAELVQAMSDLKNDTFIKPKH